MELIYKFKKKMNKQLFWVEFSTFLEHSPRFDIGKLCCVLFQSNYFFRLMKDIQLIFFNNSSMLNVYFYNTVN